MNQQQQQPLVINTVYHNPSPIQATNILTTTGSSNSLNSEPNHNHNLMPENNNEYKFSESKPLLPSLSTK